MTAQHNKLSHVNVLLCQRCRVRQFAAVRHPQRKQVLWYGQLAGCQPIIWPSYLLTVLTIDCQQLVHPGLCYVISTDRPKRCCCYIKPITRPPIYSVQSNANLYNISLHFALLTRPSTLIIWDYDSSKRYFNSKSFYLSTMLQMQKLAHAHADTIRAGAATLQFYKPFSVRAKLHSR